MAACVGPTSDDGIPQVRSVTTPFSAADAVAASTSRRADASAVRATPTRTSLVEGVVSGVIEVRIWAGHLR